MIGKLTSSIDGERVYFDPRKDPLTGESRALDPNDPIDRAILARLAERESLGLANASDPFETGRRVEDGNGAGSGRLGKKQVAFGKRL